jgi:hypothetical protein
VIPVLVLFTIEKLLVSSIVYLVPFFVVFKVPKNSVGLLLFPSINVSEVNFNNSEVPETILLEPISMSELLL